MTEVAPQVQVPVVGNTITRQARRLYVGNIPFGVSDVRAAEVCTFVSFVGFNRVIPRVRLSRVGGDDGLFQPADAFIGSCSSARQSHSGLPDQLGQELCVLRSM